MADFNYDEFDSGYDTSFANNPRLAEKARRWVNIAGAVCSVSLVLGLAFWGYRLAVRDVTGVPVMRAVAGAMRVAPTEPGGEQALNQGLTVNAIAAMGTSAATADQVTLAPMPVALDEADQPAQASGDSVAQQDPNLTISGDTTAANAVTLDHPLAEDDPEALADAAATAAEAEPVTIATNDPNVVSRSLRPHPRPAGLAGKDAGKPAPTKVQTVSAKAPPKAAEIDPAKIPVGTRLAQLGAFETPELARAKFAELQDMFGDLMLGKDMVVQSATSGGRVFYRLRAHGFQNDDDARGFCAALRAEEAECIPTVQK